MPTEMTIEAAMIELNRLKTTERMEIDRERLTAAIDVVKGAAQFRIKRKPERVLTLSPRRNRFEYRCVCDRCKVEVDQITDDYCPTCGQAIDWEVKE